MFISQYYSIFYCTGIPACTVCCNIDYSAHCAHQGFVCLIQVSQYTAKQHYPFHSDWRAPLLIWHVILLTYIWKRLFWARWKHDWQDQVVQRDGSGCWKCRHTVTAVIAMLVGRVWLTYEVLYLPEYKMTLIKDSFPQNKTCLPRENYWPGYKVTPKNTALAKKKYLTISFIHLIRQAC